MNRENDNITRSDDCIQFMKDLKEAVPPAVYAFVDAHEHDLAEDRTQAVYSCRLEDMTFIESKGEELKKDLSYAISWAEYVQDFGDYETREEFHHGTPQEWAFEVKKSNEWISLLKEWRATL
tara:strand:+ start:1153 stop:1518 length:366 start_codon:yes stop_codon:yes gene_type:complete